MTGDFLELGIRPLKKIDRKLKVLFNDSIEIAQSKQTRFFFGNELKHAHYLIDQAIVSSPDLARRFFFRPASECIVSSYYDAICSQEFDVDSYLKLASTLTLQDIPLRRTPVGMLSLHGGSTIQISSQLAPRQAIKSIISLNGQYYDIDIYYVISILAMTILHQPLMNSNSRTITAFLNLLLMRKHQLHGPPLTIGPSFVTRPEAAYSALRELHQRSNWMPFLDLFALALHEGQRSKCILP